MTALLRTVRRQRGLTLEQLAEQTGLTKSYLSKVERRQSTPSIAVALKVAQALDVDVGRLFCDESAATKLTIDRADEHRSDGERYRALASPFLGKTMSPFIVRPAQNLAADPHPEHPGQEFVFVHTGRIELDYGDRTIVLDAGDSAYFDATVSHKIRSIDSERGSARAEVVVVAHAEPKLGGAAPTRVVSNT